MPSSEPAIENAVELMRAFAERTGLTSNRPARRYLWTDAFAVCNFLALEKATGETKYTDLALRLIEQVHHTLGRHREEDAQRGWLSGLGEQEGELHPTRGGLRIGKKFPERGPDEPFDPRLEWDRDGQYFHYLTKWMHALDQVARFTREPRCNLWARELAETAHAAFVDRRSGSHPRRMFWKMTTDLSRPLVASMGQHDPLDGLITCIELQTTAAKFSATELGPALQEATLDFATLVEGSALSTDDPLGIGGLLTDAYRVLQLVESGANVSDDLLESLLLGAERGLVSYLSAGEMGAPPQRRLAFRELGLALGLEAVARMRATIAKAEQRRDSHAMLTATLDRLDRYTSLTSTLRSFWFDAEIRKDSSWAEHRDINDVMLATSFVPDGFLVLDGIG